MKKLLEIEAKFMNDQDDGHDIRWLIDRVKRLTEALETIRDYKCGDCNIIARKALEAE